MTLVLLLMFYSGVFLKRIYLVFTAFKAKVNYSNLKISSYRIPLVINISIVFAKKFELLVVLLFKQSILKIKPIIQLKSTETLVYLLFIKYNVLNKTNLTKF